jgi:hypothetical protein
MTGIGRFLSGSRPGRNFFLENTHAPLWHIACSADLGAIDMKQRDENSYDGQNWAWPENTWFRERLNAIKAREQGNRRKIVGSPQKPMAVEAKPGDDKGTQEG